MSCRSCAISGTTRNCSDNELNAHVHKTVMHFLLFLVVFLTITHNLKRFGKFGPNSLVLMYICNSNRTFFNSKIRENNHFQGEGARQIFRYVQFTLYFRYGRYCDIYDIVVSMSLQYRCAVIQMYLGYKTLHCRYRDVEDTV